MIKRILVPLDGSRSAEGALGHTSLLARALGAEVELLRVVNDPGRRGPDEPADPLAWRLADARAEAYLSEVAGRLRKPGVRVKTRVREGVPSEEIVAAIRGGGHDLVIVTDHGSGTRAPTVLGGTALAVTISAGVSVLLVRSRDEPPSPDAFEYQEILAPVDCSPRGDWALGVAAGLARATGARLQMVHVLAIPEVLSRDPSGDTMPAPVEEIREGNRRAARQYMDEMARCLGGEELEIEGLIVEPDGGVARTLNRLATTRASDLIVLSAHGRGAATEWPLGSVAATTLLSASQPLLLLQDMAGEGAPAGVLEDRSAKSSPRPRTTSRHQTG